MKKITYKSGIDLIPLILVILGCILTILLPVYQNNNTTKILSIPNLVNGLSPQKIYKLNNMPNNYSNYLLEYKTERFYCIIFYSLEVGTNSLKVQCK